MELEKITYNIEIKFKISKKKLKQILKKMKNA